MSTNPGFELQETFDTSTNEKHNKTIAPHADYPDEQPLNSSDNWLLRRLQAQWTCSDNLVIKLAGYSLQIGLIWVLLYIFFHKEVTLNGGLFMILVLSLTAILVGKLFKIIYLPPLLGMLLTGIIFKTSGYYQISGVYTEIVIVLREVALCVILIRAGLGLDAKALLKLSFVLCRLAMLPLLGETIGVALASYFILGYPWLWGIMLGFLLAAVSPAVVVPSLLSLKERGYGEDKGIPTLVIGASSLDDITAISGFGVLMGMIFSQGDLTQQLLQGPKEVLIGLSTGIGFGVIAAYLPHKSDTGITFKRSALIGGWGLLAVLGSQSIGLPGAGPLSCITAALVAGICWKLQGWDNDNPVSKVFGTSWGIMEPVLFSLIGAEVDLRKLQLDTVGLGVAVIICGLTFRIAACLIAVMGTDLNLKERIFTNLAWIPKATVQAALASKPLDLVNELSDPSKSDVERSTQILTIAVLAILITAPIGAIGVAVSGPKLLSKDKQNTNNIVKQCP